MQFVTPIANLVGLLASQVPSTTFFAKLRESELLADASDPIERDIELAFQMYFDMMDFVTDQTFFGIQAGQLVNICVEHFEDPARIAATLQQKFGPHPKLDSRTLSVFIVFSFIARKYDDLFLLVNRYITEHANRGVLDGTLMITLRSLLTSSNFIYSTSSSGPIPMAVRNALQTNSPMGSVRNIADSVDAIVRARSQALHAEHPPVTILFAMDDFVADRLNTLTKLYCDYFYVLAKHTRARIVIRVYPITLGYTGSPMMAIWDPPRVVLADLMTDYFGDEGKEIAAKIDFSYVNCWTPTEDYIQTIKNDIDRIRPDACVTCLERHSSFLEIVLYELAPLLQIEVINGSGFVRHCDALIPNGTVSEARKQQFHCVDAPLPQIPFPIVAPISKAQLGFDAQSFVIAVVAKEFPRRMEMEGKHALSKAFAASLVGLQMAHTNVAILLVGELPSEVIAWFQRASVNPDWNRTKIIEFAQDLRATMQACDVIVNPPQRGGARGLGLAISDQKPVIIFDDADAANFVPISNICNDIVSFEGLISRYLKLGHGYKENYIAASGEAPFSEAYNQNCATSFIDAIRYVGRSGNARLSAARDTIVKRTVSY